MANDAGKKANDKKSVSVKKDKKSSKPLLPLKATTKKTFESVKVEKSEKKSNLLSKIAGKVFNNNDKKVKQQTTVNVKSESIMSGEKTVKIDKLAVDKAIKAKNASAKSTVLKSEKAAEQKIEKAVKSKAVKSAKIITPEPKEIKEPPVVENIIDDRMSLSRKNSKRNQPHYQPSTEEEAKWFDLKEKYKGNRPSPYKMSEIYQEKTLLDHKVLGLGVILSVVNDRLEVLFQTGTKHLISNYKK